MKKFIIPGLIAVFIISDITIFYSFSVIHDGVEEITTIARDEFKENSIDSLIKLIDSVKHGFEEKNTAIWALGQYADKRALNYLEKISEVADDQTPCDRHKDLCKKEIDRAIKWCKKGNITSWMYRKIE